MSLTRRRAIACAIAVLAAGLVPAATADANRFGPPWLGVVEAEGTVTRAAPSRRSAPIGPLRRGALVPVLGVERGGGAHWLATPVGFLPASDVSEHREPWVAEALVPGAALRSPRRGAPERRQVDAGALQRVVGLSPGVGGDTGVWWATTDGYLPFEVLWPTPSAAGAAWVLPRGDEAPSGWWGEVTTTANVRLGPGTDTARVGLLAAGARVKVLQEQAGQPVDGDSTWYRIDGGRYAGAWLHASLVRRIAPPAPNASAPTPEPPDRTWIVVDRAASTLTLVEQGRPVFATYMSGGDALDETPTGDYATVGKYRFDDMTSTSVPDADHFYDLPNVPHTLYFRAGGFAIHGAYWHDEFGRPHSEGCVNLTLGDAAYLFPRTRPRLEPGQNARWAPAGDATPVLIVG